MKLALFSSLLALSLHAAEMPPTPQPPAATPQPTTDAAGAMMNNAPKPFYAVDPKNRAADLIQAYDLLKKEKPTLKISLRTSSATVIANIMDITAASKGTILFVKILSNIGPKTMVVPVEDVAEIYYSS